MLVHHRVDDVGEGLIAVEQTVPPRQQITFQPTLAHVLRQDFEHAPVASQMLIARQNRCAPLFVADVVHRTEPVRRGLIGSEQPEVAVAGVAHHHFAQIPAEHPGRFGHRIPGSDRGHGEFLGDRQVQRRQQQATVGVWVRTHPMFGRRHVVGDQLCGTTGFIEQFLGR